jgi:acid phosphatase type 7
MKKLLLFTLLFSAVYTSKAQVELGIIRNPYIQLTTPNSTTIKWRTLPDNASTLKYGTKPNELTQEVEVSQEGLDQVARIQGLSPNTKYFYEITTPLGTIASEEHYFVTFPEKGSSKPTSIWVLGDAGRNTQEHVDVTNAFLNYHPQPVDLMLMLGDNAYMTGQDAEYQIGLFDMHPTTLINTPFFPTFGNHDSYGTVPILEEGPFYLNFELPTLGEYGGVPSNTENYYSFDYANIHFISLDANMTQTLLHGNAMVEWLESDLQNNTQYWTIVFFHHPPYTKGSHDSDTEDELIYMREVINPILEQYGVDLVMGGHSHCYERSYFLNGHYANSSEFSEANKVQSGNGLIDGDGYYRKNFGANQGVVYMVAGSSCQIGGGSLDHAAMVNSYNEPGSVLLEIEGQRLVSKFINSSGEIKDVFGIEKNYTTSVKEKQSTQMIALYPNPSSDQINIEFEVRKAQTRLEIINIEGKKVYIQNIAQANGKFQKQLPVKQLPKGQYTLIIRDTEGQRIEKFIVQ